jgi:hypothetical protein
LKIENAKLKSVLNKFLKNEEKMRIESEKTVRIKNSDFLASAFSILEFSFN